MLLRNIICWNQCLANSSSLGFFLSASSYKPATWDSERSIETGCSNCTLSEHVQSLFHICKKASVHRTGFSDFLNQGCYFGISAIVQVKPCQSLIDLSNRENSKTLAVRAVQRDEQSLQGMLLFWAPLCRLAAHIYIVRHRSLLNREWAPILEKGPWGITCSFRDLLHLCWNLVRAKNVGCSPTRALWEARRSFFFSILKS